MKAASYPSAAPFLPEMRSLRALRAAVNSCQGCPLYRFATQAVLGEGSPNAQIMFVGEQPGNEEDLQGHPFVGPAGKLLDRALAGADLARASVYVTNAVKHFKFEERGKRRIHKQPSALEVRACRPWLDAEIHTVRPRVLVCLGATAAKSILGNQFRLTAGRGTPIPHELADYVVATIHPSAILRIPQPDARHTEFARLVGDLKRVRSLVHDAAHV